MPNAMNELRTLAIDIGGSGLKMMVLDEKAQSLTERTRIDTPHPATPDAVICDLVSMMPKHKPFDRVSIGFPGVVRKGIVETAPNMDPAWQNFPLQKAMEKIAHSPVRVANDADVQGLGIINGDGVELVITLGTGMGAALFIDGNLVPNLELGHHPFKKEATYEDLLGNAALLLYGKKKWNRNLSRAINLMSRIFNFDTLYIGGGNARHIAFELPKSVKITSNLAGLWGGARLWH